MTLDGVDVMQHLLQRRRRSGVTHLLRVLCLVAVAFVAVACSPATTEVPVADSAAAPARATATMEDKSELVAPVAQGQATAAPIPAVATAPPTATPTPHPLAEADTELPPAPIGFENLFDAVPAGPQPISIEIENIGVRNADIIPVGVNEDLTFEVPPADQVGWYEFGSAPGEPGSAVLAAHIAYNGVDGVFRYLEDVAVGAVVIVGFDDGTSQRYRIEEVTEYVKEELPDSLFARDGKDQLALITCGGTFNYQLDSYESNTVAIAVPI